MANKVYHILNGDSLACSFPDTAIDGEIIVFREALIDGDLSGDSQEDFRKTRAAFLGVSYDDYQNHVVAELEKIANAPKGAEFNLWFEYDLFCQVNMWFVLNILHSLPINKTVFAVYTTHLDQSSNQFWNGFGAANVLQLQVCYAQKTPMDEADLSFGEALWKAYKNNELATLTSLSGQNAPAFPYLEEVVKAHTDRFPANGKKGRPEAVIEDIVNHLSSDFQAVCQEFWKREGIYGFGDTQLKTLYDNVMRKS